MAKIVRKFTVGGNWKMAVTKADIEEICETLSAAELDPKAEIYIGVPAPYLMFTREHLPETINIAGQNCYKVAKGAFTGEVSTAMLKDCGANWVILGHSERRQIFGEMDYLIGEKCLHALQEGMQIVYCIGETMAQRESGQTEVINACQLRSLQMYIDVENWANIIIAYEPVWAIGTGKTATPEEAQEVHAFIRNWFKEKVSEEVANSMRITYGGSVTAETCKELAAQPDIDGFLVGGASLKPEFVDIINTNKKPEEAPAT